MPFPSAVAALIAFVFVGVLAAPVASARLPPGSPGVIPWHNSYGGCCHLYCVEEPKDERT